MKQRRYYIFIFLGTALFIGLILVYTRTFKTPKLPARIGSGNPSSYSVVLSKNGFSPSSIKIKKGDRVTFTTTSGRQFWPASDPHPTHTIYPEFDPKQPVEPDQTWSFQFEKDGTFPFHDHFFPSQGGIIVVGQPSGTGENCNGPNQNNYLCWSKMIEETLRNKGLNSAFLLVDNLYQTQPAFASDCHQFLHKLGEAAYEKFVSNNDIVLTSASAYCGYGFYHGFMEKLLLESANYSQASDFCRKVSVQMSQSLSDACYHGVGHGAMANSTVDQASWGKPESFVKKALATCSKVADSEVSTARCASGVYMEISTYLSAKEYGLSADEKNPLQICETQTVDDIKMACYTQMYPVLQTISKGDASVAIKYIEAIPEDRYAVESVQTLIGSMAGVKSDQSKNIRVCSTTQKRLQAKCISGIALSFMLNGKPDEQYNQAIDFCGKNGLNKAEQDSCYGLIIQESRNVYSSSKFREVCLSLPGDYQKKCL